MARGITESDVHGAADELVAAGERPTVERIRAHLGTGSPNTVTRWLETWWRALGGRLQDKRQAFSTAEVPAAVAALAGEWWGLALEAGRAIAVESLTGDRALLLSQQDALDQARASFSDEAAALLDRAEAAAQAERAAAARIAELQRLVSQLEGRLEEVAQQRDSALTRADVAETLRQAAELRVQALQEAAQSERESVSQHIRAVENRALSEIDRARQEVKELRRQLATLTKESAEVQKALRERADRSNTEAWDASREAVVQRARADALEHQLAELRNLPADLEAVLRRGSAQSTPRKRTTRPKGKPETLKKAQAKKK
ncbi:MAG TPA: DNA-binding protein [Stenotrophomonas sp.]|nr:DNA-binding protein [Stenotrophomonas sp.]